VLLEVVAFSSDVRRDFFTVGKAHTGDLTESGVRLLRRHGGDLETDSTLHRCSVAELHALHLERVPGVLEVGGLCTAALRLAAVTYELVDGRHVARNGSG
jgi:hypothetical protein